MIDIYEGLRLAADSGVLALIWLVQLVIYPGLAQYDEHRLRSWHPQYTRRVTFIVLPLMLSQLLLSAYSAYLFREMIDLAHLGLVIIAWLITFLKAVPLHGSLESSEGGHNTAIQLIQLNKSRTILWSITWILSVVSISL